MKNNNNKNNDMIGALKIVHKQNRQEEFNLYGKSINYSHIEKSKKVYSRKIKHKGNLFSFAF